MTKNKDCPSAAAVDFQDMFELKSFFPYLVRIYYRAVSESVGAVYSNLYGLSAYEWRTMAVLGPYAALSATEIVEKSSIDKVNVSRAIAKLRERGFLKRDIDGDDRRRSVLRLTESGRTAFYALIPRVREVEAHLLQGMTPKERETLIRLMEKVRNNAGMLKDAS
ncbi:MAG: MarR family winged helix-turn-helix transcriptional regulator [Hyphomicrobiales bacterium]|nr:MarR family winged helix-turn-helix transcriptional regulator [Hyphomicrobiales bacterium]